MGAVRHRFTVEEYHKMGKAGIFGEDDRVELIEGEVVEMSPIGDRHVECVYRLTRLLSRWVFFVAPNHYGGAQASQMGIHVQNPLALGGYGEPQPDLVLVRRGAGRTGTPAPEDVLLVVEVADTSLAYDRNRKLPLYAATGIPEVWLVDLDADVIEVRSVPGEDGYATVSRVGRGGRVVAATVTDLVFDADEALPPTSPQASSQG